MPQVFKKEKTIEASNKAKIQEALDWLETMIAPTGFMAGTSNFTIADVSVLALITTLQTTKDLYADWKKLPKTVSWVEKMKNSVPNYAKSNDEGVKVFEAFFKNATGLIE